MNDTRSAPSASASARLDSWKRIAHYLGRCERTARRWEAEEGLPVHRHRHGSQHTVYAWKNELDGWLEARSAGWEREAVSAGKAAITVLPFRGRGNKLAVQLADNMSTEITSRLGAGAGNEFDIISLPSQSAANGQPATERVIRHAPNTEYYVEGSVDFTGSELFNIRLRVFRIKHGRPILDTEYVCRLEDIRTIQRKMTDSVLHAIDAGTEPSPGRGPREEEGIRPEAYEAYVRGCSLVLKSGRDAVCKSIDEFDLAISLSEDFAEAHAQKARALVMASVLGPIVPRAVMQEAYDSCLCALALSPRLAEAHLAQAFILYAFGYDWTAAERAFNRAIEINPSYSPAYQLRAEFLASLGRFDRALKDIERARQLNPASLDVMAILGFVLGRGRRFEETIAVMDDLLARNRNHMIAYIECGLAWAHLGDFEKAEEIFATGAERSGGYPDLVALRAFALGRLGRTGEARDLHAGLRAGRKDTVPYDMAEAFVWLGLGEYEKAMDALEAAHGQRVWHINLLGQEAIFDPLREMPRFQALLKKAGLDRSAYRMSGP